MKSSEQKIVIDGVTFQVAPFMATTGLRLKAYLIRTFGPALGELLGGIDGQKITSFNELNLGTSGISTGISRGLEKLLEQLNEDSFEALVKRLLTNVIANWNEDGKNRSISFGTDFETAMQLVFLGRLFSIYELILFVLKVNYPDFFGKVVRGIGQKMSTTLTSNPQEPALQSESKTSETSEN